jgi:hypothetical protein
MPALAISLMQVLGARKAIPQAARRLPRPLRHPRAVLRGLVPCRRHRAVPCRRGARHDARRVSQRQPTMDKERKKEKEREKETRNENREEDV